MKNNNKISPPLSAPSQKSNFSYRNNDHYVDLLQKYGNNSVINNNSHNHKKVFDDVTIDRQLISTIFGPPKFVIKESIDDINNYRYQQELTRKKKSKLTEDQKTMLFDRLSLSKVITTDNSSTISPYTTPTKASDRFDFNKKFVETRFKRVDKTISLPQLELILHFFSIIDRNIDEKPLISQELIPLCQIDDETYDSEKLKEALIQSFKKANESNFWSEVSNCIISSRLNGKMKVFSAKSPPKTDPPKKQKRSSQLTKKNSINRAIQFSDDESYTSDDETTGKRPPNTQLSHLLFGSSDDLSNTNKKINSEQQQKEEKEKEINHNNNTTATNNNDHDKDNENTFVEEEEEFEENEFEKIFSKEEERNSESKNEEEEEKVQFDENGSKSDNQTKNAKKRNPKRAKFSKEIEKMKQNHSSQEKVPSTHKRRKNFKNKNQQNQNQNQDNSDLLSNKDNDKLSEYEYNYYSEEQVIKSSVTFDDLIHEAASQHFEDNEFQSIADEASNTKSHISYDSIDYSNDEDLYIKTKKRWKHKHRKSSSLNSGHQEQQNENEKQQNHETHEAQENSENHHENGGNENDSGAAKQAFDDQENSDEIHENRKFYDDHENSDDGYQNKQNAEHKQDNEDDIREEENPAYKLNADDLRILEDYLDDEDKQNTDDVHILDDEVNSEDKQQSNENHQSNENLHILDDRLTTDEKQNSDDFDMLDDQASSEDQQNSENPQEYKVEEEEEENEQKLEDQQNCSNPDNLQEYEEIEVEEEEEEEEEQRSENSQEIGKKQNKNNKNSFVLRDIESKAKNENKIHSISEDDQISENFQSPENNENQKSVDRQQFVYRSDDYNTEDASDEPMFFERLKVVPASEDLREDIGVQTESEVNNKEANSRYSSSEFGQYPVTVPIEDVDENEFDENFSENQNQE